MSASPIQAGAGPAHARLREIAWVFGRLGVLGFGGPVAVMAMMEEQAVRARRWMAPSEFGELYAVCKLLPGPVGTQMAIALGRARGGTWGGVVAGLAFILPCFGMVLGLSALYADTGAVQAAGVAAALGGLQAAALSVILFSTWGLGRAYRGRASAWAVAALSAAVVLWRPSYEPLMILGAGLIGAWLASRAGSGGGGGARGGTGAGGRLKGLAAWVAPACAGAVAGGGWAMASARAVAAQASTDPTVLGKLFWMCFKAGFLVFGTGLAVVPVLEADAVDRYGWLTHSQFMDGLAVGQVTPGPVVITSTFIGYLAARLPGALAATASMFLPSFINVLVIVPRVWRRVSGTPGARGFSDWAIPAVVGGILGTALRLGMLTLVSWQAALIFGASLAGASLLRLPAWALIPLSGALGAALG
jgi:chromate transporter